MWAQSSGMSAAVGLAAREILATSRRRDRGLGRNEARLFDDRTDRTTTTVTSHAGSSFTIRVSRHAQSASGCPGTTQWRTPSSWTSAVKGAPSIPSCKWPETSTARMPSAASPRGRGDQERRIKVNDDDPQQPARTGGNLMVWRYGQYLKCGRDSPVFCRKHRVIHRSSSHGCFLLQGLPPFEEGIDVRMIRSKSGIWWAWKQVNDSTLEQKKLFLGNLTLFLCKRALVSPIILRCSISSKAGMRTQDDSKARKIIALPNLGNFIVWTSCEHFSVWSI